MACVATTAAPAVSAVPPARDPAIDRFRGLAILMMVLANFLEHVHAVPGWLKHAPDVGITVIDFIAPAFIFAIGLTFPGSFRRRLGRDGGRRAVEHTVVRALALIGLGTLFSIGEWRFGLGGGGMPWGTLQSIGAAIILVLPSLFLRPRPAWPWPWRAWSPTNGFSTRSGSARWWRPRIAGLQGSLSWGLLLAIATVFADWHAGNHGGWFFAAAVLMLVAGILAALWIPVSKHRMSLSFVLIAAAASAIAFVVFEVTRDRPRGEGRLLAAWGRNPLVLYVAHFFLLAVFLVPPAPWWHVEAPLWLTAVQAAGFVAVLHALAAWLRRRNVVVAL